MALCEGKSWGNLGFHMFLPAVWRRKPSLFLSQSSPAAIGRHPEARAEAQQVLNSMGALAR